MGRSVRTTIAGSARVGIEGQAAIIGGFASAMEPAVQGTSLARYSPPYSDAGPGLYFYM